MSYEGFVVYVDYIKSIYPNWGNRRVVRYAFRSWETMWQMDAEDRRVVCGDGRLRGIERFSTQNINCFCSERMYHFTFD